MRLLPRRALAAWWGRRERGRSRSVSNFEANRTLWERYAELWTPASAAGNERGTAPPLLGDEWGTPGEIDEIVANEILPFVGRFSRVGEIGIGGGRIASRVAPHVAELVGFDVSRRMLDRAAAALPDQHNVGYVLLTEPQLPRRFQGAFDFLYAFDVFVHLDLHTMWRYFQEIRRVLKPAGRAFLHTANLAAPQGWRRFAAQDRYTIEGHYFVSPEVVAILAGHAGLEILPGKEPCPAGSYRARDGFFRLAPAADTA